MTKRNRKAIYGVLLVGILLLNSFLTFQSPEGTVSLSEGLRHWLAQFGFRSDFHSFRSNAHFIVFFMIGLMLGLFGRETGWPWRFIVLIGFLLSCIDEGIKFFLPTREFDLADLIRDWIGLFSAFTTISIICRLNCRDER